MSIKAYAESIMFSAFRRGHNKALYYTAKPESSESEDDGEINSINNPRSFYDAATTSETFIENHRYGSKPPAKEKKKRSKKTKKADKRKKKKIYNSSPSLSNHQTHPVQVTVK